MADLEEGGMREQIVFLEEYEGLPSDEMSVVSLPFEKEGKWVAAEAFQAADGSPLYEIGDVRQEPRGVFLGDRAVVEMEPGVRILACYNRQEGAELRTRRTGEGVPGGQRPERPTWVWQGQGSGRQGGENSGSDGRVGD